jgi:mono/diheme cytochrome c family protein
VNRAIAFLLFTGTSLLTYGSGGRAVFADVPEKTRSKPNPLANDRDAPVAGAKLFREHCEECHGAAGEGSKGAPRLISTEMRHATPGEIFWVITNGVVRHGMPSWSKLPPPERWQIVAFLKGLNAQPSRGSQTSPIIHGSEEHPQR